MKESMNVCMHGALCVITFSRPEKKNALSLELLAQVKDALENAASDPSCSIVAITGQGAYFTSGNDLSNFLSSDQPAQRELLGLPSSGAAPDLKDVARRGRDFFSKFVDVIIDFPKVLVAVVNGPAVGLGVTMLPLMDMAICVDDAMLWTPFVSLGLVPEACSSYTFPQLMGPAKASQMLLFGHKMTAREALACGLVTKLVKKCELQRELDTLQHLADTSPPQTLLAAKNLIKQHTRQRLHQVNQKEGEELLKRWLSEEFFQCIYSNLAKKSKL
ncbi:Enoyl-CoA hydratase/isomerase HIBYL-CoA-H type [Trinorchestia longiramus]|nr:Enoyl-CoA hydratase/isomerase HIBYL-CoA-H type [Trinorchestia longiramus]